MYAQSPRCARVGKPCLVIKGAHNQVGETSTFSFHGVFKLNRFLKQISPF